MRILIATVVCLFVFGCTEETTSQQDAQENKNTPAYSQPQTPNDKDAALTKQLKENYEKTKIEYESNPNDEKAKKEFIEATVKYATDVMMGPGAPKEKYPLALKLYDEALELKPDHEAANEGKQLILSIYEQMGRTPPKLDE